MKKIIFFLSLAFICSCQTEEKTPKGYVNFETPAGEEPKITNYYFIRHAEKDLTTKDNPQLTLEGVERAAFWGEYFKDKALDLFYTTKYMRNFQTVIPIVHHYKKNPTTYSVTKDSLFTEEFWKETYGKNAVIVGHSNTTHAFCNEILRAEKYSEIDEKQYGNLYHIQIDEKGKIKDTLLFFEEFELSESIRKEIRAGFIE
jgi:broad specificity phosphatase PhoE